MNPISNPVFDEPVFQEGQPLPDPTGFHILHPSDTATYAEIAKLLKTQVVPVPVSRAAAGDVYPLADAFGAKGAAVVKAITDAGKMCFTARATPERAIPPSTRRKSP